MWFRILKSKAEKIREKGPVDLSITNREPCCSHQKEEHTFQCVLFLFMLCIFRLED